MVKDDMADSGYDEASTQDSIDPMDEEIQQSSSWLITTLAIITTVSIIVYLRR